jgi:holin-like protein
MIGYLTLIFALQLAGEAAARGLALPVPGPVLGMVALFVFFVLRGGIPAEVGRIADTLLGALSLLFVPAGVGLILHVPRLAADWQPIVAALVVSTGLTIALTGWLMTRLTARAAEAGK